MPEEKLPFPPPEGKYGSGDNRDERAYLSRFYVAALKVLGQNGEIDGSESVDHVFSMMQGTERGQAIAREFRQMFGDGNIALDTLRRLGYEITAQVHKRYYRTDRPCAKLYDASIFRRPDLT